MMKHLIMLTFSFALLWSNANANTVKFPLNNAGPKGEPFLVVIDAGHGGHDSGALGKDHKEKDLALQIALKAGTALEKSNPNIKVMYTRTTDVFIPLYQRIRLANKKKADLFVSIHCNWISIASTKGTETFVMGLHRAQENLEVARRENEVILLESDYESNYDGFDPNSPVGHILLSTFQDAYLNQSIKLADRVEKNFAKSGMSISRGVKQAGFAVLRRATMPSILVETGFLSNEEEEVTLASEEGQHKIASSIVISINEYFENADYLKPAKGKKEKKITSHDLVVLPPSAKEVAVANAKVANAHHQQVPTTVTNTANATTQQASKSTTVSTKKNVDSKSKKSMVYRVQIAAIKTESKEINEKQFASYGELKVIFQNNLYKYQVGDFDNQEAALAVKNKIKETYPNAFVTAITQ